VKRPAPAVSALFALFIGLPAAAAPGPLRSYNVDPAQVSVSGFSAGAFMAGQLGIAYSSRFMGVGVIAGGYYDCVSSGTWRCSRSASTSIAQMNAWSGSLIDPVSNIARQKIYVFTGTSDSVVGPTATDQVVNLYNSFVPPSNIHYDNASAAGHTFPTDFDAAGDTPCVTPSGNRISNCGFDGAGAVLRWIYGPLNPRNTGTLGGTLFQFDQGAFAPPGIGMDNEGWAYVPAGCATGQACKLHIALHGCGQGYSEIGAAFLNNTGYNHWADTNNIVILYPQGVIDPTQGNYDNITGKPVSCWDYYTGYGANYDQHGGVQIEAIMRMVTQITGGHLPAAVNYQGLWWNPAESGWGVNFVHQGDQVFATWYTYDTGGNAYWLSMLASRTTPTGNAYKGDVYVDTGPPFNNFAGSGVAIKVGDGTVTLADANNGTFFYEISAGGAANVQQTKAITRFSLGGAQPTCTYSNAPDLAAATNFQDLWWVPAESGWGVNFAHQGNQLFATWYTYDAKSAGGNAPLWLSALMARQGTSNVFTGPLTRTSGPRFDNYKASDIVQPVPTVGTVTATFTDGNHATFRYATNGTGNLPVVDQAKSITRFLFAAPAGTTCQ